MKIPLVNQKKKNNDTEFKHTRLKQLSGLEVEIRGAESNFCSFIGTIERCAEDHYELIGLFNSRKGGEFDTLYISVKEVGAVGDDYIVMKMDYVFYRRDRV
jgi:hypothetical protein